MWETNTLVVRQAAHSRVSQAGGASVCSLLLAAVAMFSPSSGFAQELVLSANVNKPTFFENEPVYLLVQLRNVGSDTAWVFYFSLVSPAVTLSMGRRGEKVVPVGRPVANYFVPPRWRGSLYCRAQAI